MPDKHSTAAPVSGSTYDTSIGGYLFVPLGTEVSQNGESCILVKRATLTPRKSSSDFASWTAVEDEEVVISRDRRSDDEATLTFPTTTVATKTGDPVEQVTIRGHWIKGSPTEDASNKDGVWLEGLVTVTHRASGSTGSPL
jgi:hypothetical protein